MKKTYLKTVKFRGMEIHLYESKEHPGYIVIDIETNSLENKFTYESSRVPKLKFFVNEDVFILKQDGSEEKIL